MLQLIFTLTKNNINKNILLISAIIDTIGDGVFFSIQMFFLHLIGFSVIEITTAITLAGIFATVITIYIGKCIDRYGEKNIYNLSLVLLPISMLLIAYYATTNILLIVYLAIYFLSKKMYTTARLSIVSKLRIKQSEKIKLRAKIRSFNNLGMSIGVLIGSLFVSVNAISMYRFSILINALSYICILALSKKIFNKLTDNVTDNRLFKQQSKKHVFLQDKPFTVLMVFNGLLLFSISLIEIAYPFIFIRYFHGIKFIYPYLILFNTVAIILLQSRFTTYIKSIRHATNGYLGNGIILFIVCTIIYTISSVGLIDYKIKLIFILTLMLLLTLSELLQFSSSNYLSSTLPKKEYIGEYSSIYTFGTSLMPILGPAIIGISFKNSIFWIACGILFATVGSISKFVRVNRY